MVAAAARPRGRQSQIAGASKPDAVPLDCVTAKPRSRTSTTTRWLDKALFQQLATCCWTAGHRRSAGQGPRAAWASRGYPARWRRRPATMGYTVHCARVPRPFADLDLSHGDGPLRARLFRILVKVDLFVVEFNVARWSCLHHQGLGRDQSAIRAHQPTLRAPLDADHCQSALRRMELGSSRTRWRGGQ